MISRWFPKFERGFMSTLIYSGQSIGTVITMPLTAYISSSEKLGGWPSAFHILGFFGCIWCILWMLLIYESPEIHPRITEKEFKYILDGQDFGKNKLVMI